MASKFDDIAAMMGGGMPQQMAPGPAQGGGAGILQALQQMLGGGMSGAPDPRMMAEMGPMLGRPRQSASMDPRAGGVEIPMAMPTQDNVGPAYPEPTRGEMGENDPRMMRDTMNERMTESMPSPGGPTKYMDRSDGGPPMTDEEEIENVRKKMGAEGEEYVWEGDKKTGPTPNDIKYMKENPTDGVLEDFESYFGITPNANENTEEEEE